MSDAMNHEFCVGFSKYFGVLGIDRKAQPGQALFEAILKNESQIQWIGGRSAGSVASVEAVCGPFGQNITHLVLLSYPFSPGYRGESCRLLQRIPRHVKILFLLGDNDRFGSLNEEGKSLDASYAWLNKNLATTHEIWKVNLRNTSHSSNLEEKHGGEKGRDQMLNMVGELSTSWLAYHSENDTVEREGAIYYDMNADQAAWTGWKGVYGLKEAAQDGI